MNRPIHRMRVIVICAWIVAFGAIRAGAGRAAELPAGFVEEVLADQLNAATAVASARDGRIFIAEQTGLLRVWKDGALLATPSLDLSQRVDTYWERGLIGVTFHPDFPHTPYLFVLYVAHAPYPHHVLSRFRMEGDAADPASERVLLEGDDQTKLAVKLVGAHQGGPLRFGVDGCLYVALGEQTSRQPAQSIHSLAGKILRIHADGTVPDDNPFITQTDGKYRNIWALGLRNPFGLAVQPGTGRLFATDVGETSFEEVNEILRGANYGWPEAEGLSNDGRFKNPIHTYPPLVGRSICGAAFYPQHLENAHGEMFPEKWRGKFFFADWAAHWVNVLDPEAPATVTTFARGFNGPVAVEVDANGSLLVLNRGTIWRDNKQFAPKTGSLIRIRYAPAADHLTQRAEVPRTLGATNLFATLSPLAPRDGFLRVEINLPPWQPGLRTTRWFLVPPGKQIKCSVDGDWKFPDGSIFVQHYQLAANDAQQGAPFETHVLWLTGGRSARAAAYRWSRNGEAATIIRDPELVAIPEQKGRWFSPGIDEHFNLDTAVGGFVVPISTRQLNCAITEPGSGRAVNQLLFWSERGWLEPAIAPEDAAKLPRLAPLDDDSSSLEARVRSFLDVNCSACHRPGGFARSVFDARFATPLAQQGLVNGELIAGDLGIADSRIIVPGSPEKSILYQRLKRTDFFRMPPTALSDEPSPVLPILHRWIRTLP